MYQIPMLTKAHPVREEDVQAVERSCELLNKFLEDEEFVAGDTLTIADFAISTTISVLSVSIREQGMKQSYNVETSDKRWYT